MIIMRMMGGLGNQLFQYALGRYLAAENQAELRLDTSWFEGDFGPDTPRRFTLCHFDIRNEKATEADLTAVLGRTGRQFGKKVSYLNPDTGARLFNYYREKQENPPQSTDGLTAYRWHFNPRISSISGDCYLHGYWQSEKYFQGAQRELRDELTVSTDPEGKNRETLEEIRDEKSVAVHVRRGDIDGTGDVLDRSYYKKASEHVATETAEPKFYIFSNDHRWAKANLNLDYPVTVVDHNDGTTDYEDLRLMYSCDHNIIANSTFSWWASWLNDNPEQIVVSPANWFSGKQQRDLVPERWTTIDNSLV